MSLTLGLLAVFGGGWAILGMYKCVHLRWTQKALHDAKVRGKRNPKGDSKLKRFLDYTSRYRKIYIVLYDEDFRYSKV